MKYRLWMLLACILFLAGCSESQETMVENTFSLSYEEQTAYKEQIDQVLTGMYWHYDEDSFSFFEENVPSENEGNGSQVLAASKDGGYDLDRMQGRSAVVATVNLTHFNGDRAGVCYAYFIRDELAGIYYIASNHPDMPVSLNERNVFVSGVSFSAYETETSMGSFTSRSSNIPQEGFSSMGLDQDGNVMICALDDTRVRVYRYTNRLTLLRTLYFGGYVPISAGFYQNTAGQTELAVVVGSRIITEGEESTSEEPGFVVSEKVYFYDTNLNRKSQELTTSTGNYTCVSSDGPNLVLSNDKILEYYVLEEDEFHKDKSYYLDHRLTAFLAVDLDQDGTMEYAMTDGMDFYLYHLTEAGFENLWKTHLSINSLTGYIYGGDLNCDGVKELYINDSTGTSIRYVLTPTGLKSRNEDIEYGQRIYPCDFNQDGLDDYIKVEDLANENQNIYIANQVEDEG